MVIAGAESTPPERTVGRPLRFVPAAASLVVVIAAWWTATAAVPTGLAVDGQVAERFLRTAEVISVEDFISGGITKPQRATLSDGRRTLRAIFKTVDVVHDSVRDASGREQTNLADSYRHEIAAYHLDRLLGLGIVPPCVERTVDGTTGALCLWVEGAFSEWRRTEQLELSPPDPVDFAARMALVRFFQQLIWDTDACNRSNILIDDAWKVYKIDSSRAFRAAPEPPREPALDDVPRAVIDAMRRLERRELEAALERWLDDRQIDGLWARRGWFLERS
jgi:hypothetical protein